MLIIGGGSAGISVAARLRRSGVSDIGLIEPSGTHYYQPLWTLAGGGCAAIRKQAPVVANNLTAAMNGKPASEQYDGYASCPLTTARNKILLAEFEYTMKPAPTFPIIDTTKERRDMWYLKRYGLPAMYWNLMLKGLA